MSSVDGDLKTTVGGEEYTLRLTMRGLGELQDEYGRDLAPIMVGEGELPHMGAMVRIVEIALKRHHPEAGPDVADDIISANPTIAVDLIQRAFPKADPKAAAGKRKAAKG